MSRLSWNQPICEVDWIEQNSKWDDRLLTSILMPTRVVGAIVILETCAWCGAPTVLGAYVRADPASVPFPAVKED